MAAIQHGSGIPTATFVRVALLNFFLAAVLGASMRYAFVSELPWLKYRNVMHAHSHVAMLGWVYLILAILLWKAFGETAGSKVFSNLFWLTEFSVVGMLVSFPLQGYGTFSITFSILFILLAYVFSYKLWRSLSGKTGHGELMARTALVWLLLSTLGIWAMGPVMALGAKGSTFYYMSIQFFLHFQFNGWFTFAAMALLFRQANQLGLTYHQKDFYRFYWLLVVSCVFTFALAVTWAQPEDFLFIANSLGVFLQLIALFYFLRVVNRYFRGGLRTHIDGFTTTFYTLAWLSFVAKIVIQTAVVVPQIAVVSYTIRAYVLGFIHLILLGSITFLALGYGFATNAINYKRFIARTGWILLIAGFLLTELILFGQGTLLWAGKGFITHYYIIIFGASLLLPLGILLGLLGQGEKLSAENVNHV